MQSPPKSFLWLSSWYHQDIRYEYPSMDAAAAGYIGTLDAAGSAELHSYLGDLVASDASDDELRKLWSDSGAEWNVAPIRPFFERVRARLTNQVTSVRPPGKD